MKRHFLKLIALVSFSFLWGCADSHNLNVTNQNSNVRLTTTDSIYIAISKDGSYGNKNYQGSGLMVSKAIQSELITRLNNVVIAESPSSYVDSVEYASNNGYDYLIYPTILHWEDRATEWSGKPDKVKLKISVIKLDDESEIKSGIIDGKSGLGTFGGDKPQDLLPKPVNEFISDLM